MRELNYWLHRCAYEGGHEILDAEHRLTIGFSKCAKDHDMVDSILRRDGQAFDANYERVYGGGIWKARYSLWYLPVKWRRAISLSFRVPVALPFAD